MKMNLLLRSCFAVILMGFSIAMDAQLPQNPIGSNPLSLKWRQINTDRVQVIYPTPLESAAQRVANIVDFMWEMEEKSIA